MCGHRRHLVKATHAPVEIAAAAPIRAAVPINVPATIVVTFQRIVIPTCATAVPPIGLLAAVHGIALAVA